MFLSPTPYQWLLWGQIAVSEQVQHEISEIDQVLSVSQESQEEAQ